MSGWGRDRRVESTFGIVKERSDSARERCGKIISKSAEMLGDYDFLSGSRNRLTEINTLIEKIDEALASLGCEYTITTRR